MSQILSGLELLDVRSGFLFGRRQLLLNEQHLSGAVVLNDHYFSEPWVVGLPYELVVLFLRPFSIVLFLRVVRKSSCFFSGCLCHYLLFICYLKIQIFNFVILINLQFQCRPNLGQRRGRPTLGEACRLLRYSSNEGSGPSAFNNLGTCGFSGIAGACRRMRHGNPRNSRKIGRIVQDLATHR